MHQPTENLISMAMEVARPPSKGAQTKVLAETDPTSPIHKCNVVRILIGRSKLDGAAAAFVEKHKEALRQMLQREVQIRGRAHPPAGLEMCIRERCALEKDVH